MRRMIMLAAAAALVLTTLGSITTPVRAADSFAMSHRHPGDYSHQHYVPRDSVFTSRFNGSTVSTRCSHSFYTGTSCNTVTSYGLQSPSVVEDIEAPLDWDKNCHTSCVDLSR